VVARLGQRQLGARGQLGGDRRAEAGRRVQPAADRRTADGQLTQPGQAGLQPLDAISDLRGPRARLLAERDRYRVHQVRAAGLDHVGPFAGPPLDGRREVVQRRQHVAHDRLGGRDANGGGKRVVR
jgi:hypothetical protein